MSSIARTVVAAILAATACGALALSAADGFARSSAGGPELVLLTPGRR